MQPILGMLAPRNYFFVDLYGQSLSGERETIDQSAQRQRLFEAALLTIEDDVHRPRLRGHRGEINTRHGAPSARTWSLE